MAVKIVNDTAELNDLVLILLVFGTYLRMSEMSLSSSSIVARVIVIRKTMKKLNNIRVYR